MDSYLTATTGIAAAPTTTIPPSFLDQVLNMLESASCRALEANQHLADAQARVFGSAPSNSAGAQSNENGSNKEASKAEIIISRLGALCNLTAEGEDRARALNSRL